MNLRQLIHQLRDLVSTYTYNENLRIRSVARISLLVFITLVISSTVATLADEHKVVDEIPIVDTVQPTNLVNLEKTETSSGTDLISNQLTSLQELSNSKDPLGTPKSISPLSDNIEESPTAIIPLFLKPHPLNPQPIMKMIVPQSLNVDPRASRVFMPRSYFSGAESALICLRSKTAIIDIAVRNQIDDLSGPNFKVIGDLTNDVYITGSMSGVERYLNLQGGVQLISKSGGLSSTLLRIDLVAMSQPDIDPSFCDYGATRSSVIKSLGLTINTKQMTVTLRRKNP